MSWLGPIVFVFVVWILCRTDGPGTGGSSDGMGGW
jgi:hypothetical protein